MWQKVILYFKSIGFYRYLGTGLKIVFAEANKNANEKLQFKVRIDVREPLKEKLMPYLIYSGFGYFEK
jgi:hypothetical protein